MHQLLAVRWGEMEGPVEASPTTLLERSASHRSSTDSGLEHEGEKDGEEEEEEEREKQEKEGEEVSVDNEEEPSPSLPLPQQLMDALTAALKKVSVPFSHLSPLMDYSLSLSLFGQWREMGEANPQARHPSVAAKLLSLVHTVLSFIPLHHSLPEAIFFLKQPLSVLMAYSTEGYLSDSPSEFLIQLFEFITSLVEQGSTLDEALQTNLPNLFGPAFGIRSHAVSCKLLEYGYLSVCSQHK